MSFILETLPIIISFLLAIIVHEVAHGVTALSLGDSTAKNQGRLTLNPLPHIDPFMSVILPLTLYLLQSPFLFGGAKPVPVDTRFFKNPRRDMALVAFAGPLSNFILAVIFLLLIPLIPYFIGNQSMNQFLLLLASTSVLVNIMLGVFNLFPLPPLDGGRIMAWILPRSIARRYVRLERWGIPIMMILILTGSLHLVLQPIFEWAISLLR